MKGLRGGVTAQRVVRGLGVVHQQRQAAWLQARFGQARRGGQGRSAPGSRAPRRTGSRRTRRRAIPGGFACAPMVHVRARGAAVARPGPKARLGHIYGDQAFAQQARGAGSAPRWNSRLRRRGRAAAGGRAASVASYLRRSYSLVAKPHGSASRAVNIRKIFRRERWRHGSRNTSKGRLDHRKQSLRQAKAGWGSR